MQAVFGSDVPVPVKTKAAHLLETFVQGLHTPKKMMQAVSSSTNVLFAHQSSRGSLADVSASDSPFSTGCVPEEVHISQGLQFQLQEVI